MRWLKNKHLYIILFLLNGILWAQNNDNNSFVEISQVGTIYPQCQGAFWYADANVLLLAGGVDVRAGEPSGWQSDIIAYPDYKINKIGNPTHVELPFGPVSFGASASGPEGLYCIGGETPEGNSNLVFKIIWDAERQTVLVDSLPGLPVSLTRAGAVFFQEKLYVAGGYLANQVNNHELFILDLNDLKNGWSTIATPLGKRALSPSLLVQSDGVDDCLFLLGGVGNDCMEGNMYKYNLKQKQWITYAGILNVKSSVDNGDCSIKASLIGNSGLLLFKQIKAQGTNETAGVPVVAETGVFNAITSTYTSINNPGNFFIDELIGSNGSAALGIVKNGGGLFTFYEVKIIEAAKGFGLLNISVLVLYFGLMIWIGFYFSKRQKTADDYFKGGKRIPFWAAGLSLIGTGLSAISFMAVPAKAFASDWAYYMIRLTTIFIPVIVGLLYIPVFRGLDISTAYEYLQKRFNLSTRLVGSFSFIIFQLGRIGIVLFLPAVAINVVTGFDVVTCIIIVGMISLLYTVMGGIEAVIWTDVLQVVVLYGGIILCVAFISSEINGGVSDIIYYGKGNNKFNIFDFSFSLHEPNFWVVVIGSFFTNLTTYGSDQTMVQRYLTTKTTKDATKSIWTTVVVGFALGWLFFFMGTALFAYYKAYPEKMLHTMTSNDAIFPWYIISRLPNGFSGLLIAGIFAAAMSSLSSSMNSAATAYTVDFHRLFKREFDEVAVGRLVTILIGLGGILVAILFATLNVKSIWDEFLKIIGLMTGGLGGVFLLGIITEKANGAGVLIGLGVSAVVQYFVSVYQPFNLLLFTASGFISCFLVGYLCSWLLPMYDKPVDGLTIYSVGKKEF